MRFVEKSFFLWRRFLLLIVFKFHHTMLVLNAFLAISEGFVSDNQSPPPRRDVPLLPHLVRPLVRSHRPVIKHPKLKSYFFHNHNYGLTSSSIWNLFARVCFSKTIKIAWASHFSTRKLQGIQPQISTPDRLSTNQSAPFSEIFAFDFPLFALCFLVFALSQPIIFKKSVHVYY